ncbi:MAG: PD-(D/E)XK nuclease family protein, partial [Candidatus Sericytochromatia bacterium]
SPARLIHGAGDDPGSVSVRLAKSPHAEAALIADTLRRAHLVDGVRWSDMAVIVRSLPRAAAALPRALAAAGVPVRAAAPRTPPADHPAVRALLTVLAAAVDGLDGEKALTLVTGPIGRVDPVSLRGLRRSLRRGENSDARACSDVLLAEVLAGSRPQPAAHANALRRVRAVVDAAVSAADGDPRSALWQAWNRSGLQDRWLKTRARGGSAAAQADRDLDAVTMLFEIADGYVAHTPGATVRGLVEHVTALKIPPPEREPAVEPDTVAVVSVHAALGREWDVVVVAGMQEGLWPNTVPRGGVLRTQQLVDVLDGIADTASPRAPVLADERRLLVAALGRARRRVVVTAVDSDSDDTAVPSMFIDELTALTDGDCDAPAAPRVLSPAALVGRLRSVVCAPHDAVDEARRCCAATQLARLAAAGVPGADPGTWYGRTPVSTDQPLADDACTPVTLSPSIVQTIADCPLRWLLERHGGSDRRDIRSALGSVLHTLIASGATTEAQLLTELEPIWETLPFESAWYSRNELARHKAMLSAFWQWRAQTRHELTEIASELVIDGVLTSPDPGLPDVRVRGRIDRLERDIAGRPVIVDIKTGRNPVTKDDAQRHAQLALYQLAVSAGILDCGEQPGGGRLVYLGRPGIVERGQDALTADGEREWRQTVHRAAAATVGPNFAARINDSCGHCPVRSSCPAQGRRS